MRPPFRLLLCGAAATAALPAQGPLREGRILDVLGAPVAAATVQAVADGKVVGRTSTDGEGVYRLRLPAGGATLQVAAPGKATTRLPWRGATTAPVQNVVLEDGATLRGRVLDLAGRPLAGATVVAVTAAASQTVTTDAQGDYVFAALPLRPTALRALHGGRRGTAHLQLAADTRLDLELGYRTDGVVLRVTGLPPAAAAAAQVRVYGSDFAAVQGGGQFGLGADGSALFHPERDCLVHVVVPGFRIEPAQLAVFPTTRETRFTAVADATPPIPDQLRGSVRGLEGTGVIPQLQLVARDRSQRDLAATQSERGGAFAFRLMLPLDRFCRIGLPLGEWLLVDDEMTVRDGFSWIPVPYAGERLELLVERAGIVRDTVRDLAGIAFAYADIVVADPERPWRALVETQADRDGTIAFGLPPGTHDLLAVCHDGRVAVATVPVRAGQVATVAWQQVPTGTLDGVLRDGNGAALPGVEVFLAHASLGDAHTANAALRQRCLVRTDRDGRFRCRGLPVGTWFVSVRSDAEAAATPVDIAAERTAEIAIACRR